MKLKDKIVLITGASSGIGESTAMKLTSEGAIVVLCARSVDKLKELKNQIEKKGGKALVVETDVTKPADFKKAVSETLDKYGSVDVLINNAGLMPLSYIEKLKTDDWDQMIDVNIKGVLNGVAAVLPTMRKNKSGHIINISSSAAHRYFPAGAVYSATKIAVKMFSEGLRQELTPTYGIKVTSIEPGAVDTSLFESITDEDIKDKLEDLKEMTKLEAEDIANAIFYALSQPQRVNVNDVFLMPTEQG